MRTFIFCVITAILYISSAVAGVVAKGSYLSRPFQRNVNKIGHDVGHLTGGSCHVQNPRGFLNLRNTCYMNSVLQGVFNAVKDSEDLQNTVYTPKSVGYELVTLLMKYKSGEPMSTKSLASVMKVDVRQQEDAEEFLLNLLNGVEDSLERGSQSVTAPEGNTDSLSAQFVGEIEQTIRCEAANTTSVKKHKLFDLSVNLAQCGASDGAREYCVSESLNTLISNYFHSEVLDQYRPAGSSLSHEAVKSLTMTKLPQVLVVHLKRFGFDPQTNSMSKVSKTPA